MTLYYCKLALSQLNGSVRTGARRRIFFSVVLFVFLAGPWDETRAAFGQEIQHAAPAQVSQIPQGAVVVGKAHLLVERPLPAFTLYTAADQAVPAQALAQSGYWLVVYRDRNCKQCDALMHMLSKHNQDPSRIVFVVSGVSGSDLLQLEQQYPELAAALWLRDLKSGFSSSMNITGTPHIFGMRNGAIRWQRGGVSAADATFSAAIDGWLKYNLLPPNKFVLTPAKKPTNQKGKGTGAAGSGDSAAETGSTKGQK
jgi:hypothetical protein